ncbi:general odorant-binding protein 71 isoform X2 [Diachasma alloeum]|uniref:general odorant-binding protein 71 isoform X2 n=1 Tax=Diachasma alloeum TaxID=454923 RepID=UPI0007383E1E|nr:general odorant-binding protein 71 isoform X2 [Diachasma alloeum]
MKFFHFFLFFFSFAKMNIVTIRIILIFVIVHYTQSLRCSSGNQRLNDNYQKIMQTCRRRYNASRGEENNFSTDDSNNSEGDSSSSDGSLFGHDFLSGTKKTHGESYLNYRNGRKASSKDVMQRQNNSRNFNDGDEQFVDRRGYPERVAVTRVMTQGIQNPALRDFIEESILECFHLMPSIISCDKCAFSQNLVNCLTDKGKKECEDWND